MIWMRIGQVVGLWNDIDFSETPFDVKQKKSGCKVGESQVF